MKHFIRLFVVLIFLSGSIFALPPTFFEHTIDGSFTGAYCVSTIDLDRDGDMDILGAATEDDDIAWWENDGSENFTEHTIEADFNGARSINAADLDKDGDLDVLGAAWSANDIVWWENDGSQNFVARNINVDFSGAHCIITEDVNGDGDLDVIGAGDWETITWWESDGSPVNGGWTERTIPASTGAISVHAVDVDGDGDIDVLSAEVSHDDVIFWENTNGAGTSWTRHDIDVEFWNANNVFGSDLDGDGDTDVLGTCAGDDDITWWENTNGIGTTWSEHLIDGDFDAARSVFAADLDRDGDIDVLGTANEADDITWWENDGAEGFTEHTIDGSFNGAWDVYPADVDGDGHIDILGTALHGNEITWWENLTEPPPVPTFEEHTIDGAFDGATSVFAIDMDRDNDADVLAVAQSTDEVTWWENDGSETFTEHNIVSDFDVATSVFAADINGDGEIDVIGAANLDDDITWWENDGTENFTERDIDTDFDGARSVYAIDIDGDGDLDVLGAARVADDIAWWENDGGAGTSWNKNLIDNEYDEAFTVYGVDIDNDGDIDVLGAASSADDITWWENDGTPGGLGDWTEHTIDGSLNGSSSVFADEMDGDLDLDVLGAAYSDGDITWWENDGTPGGEGDWTEHIIDGSFSGAYSVYANDMDGDGDMDVIGAANTAGDITWWENDGTPGSEGDWIEHTIDSDFSNAGSIFSADVDGDGDIDVLGAAFGADDVTWWENKQNPNPKPSEWMINGLDAMIDGAMSVYATDLDNDGDTDILGAAGETTDDIVWWENDGSENFNKRTIDDNFDGAKSVFAADVNGDGYMDVLGAAQDADDFRWWQNDGSPGDGGWTERVIDSNINGAYCVFATDVDGDGDVDALGASIFADALTWWENSNGSGTSWNEHTVKGDFDGATSVYATDVDGDGDIDILGTAFTDDDVTWWENDGSENFTERTIDGDFDAAYWVYCTDVDLDGDIDVLAAGAIADELAWYENDGSPSDGGWTKNTIESTINYPRYIHAADIDGDGDVDVCAAASLDDDLSWWENTDWVGGSWTEHVIEGNYDGAFAAHASDVDGDGDVDIIGAALDQDDIAWWVNDINPNVDPQRIQHSIPRNRWSMVGVPVDPTNGSPGTIFQSDFDGNAPNGENWRISRYHASTQGYKRYQEDNTNGAPAGNPASFEPGLGFWVVQDCRDNAVMDIASNQHNGEVNQATRFDVALTAPTSGPARRGLTQVANPFNHMLDWRTTWIYNATDDQYKTLFEAAASNWISGYAYVWDGWSESYVNTNFSGTAVPYNLNPWQGFWLEQLVVDKELHVQFASQCMLDDIENDYDPPRPDSDVGEWSLQLSISTADGEFNDPNNILGVNAFSSDDYDLMDAIEFTPHATRFVHLFFPHEDWPIIPTRFTYDYRAADLNNERVWDFTIRTYNLPDQELILSWHNINEIPDNVGFILTDNEDLMINLREEESFTFRTNEARQQYFNFTLTSLGNVSVPGRTVNIPTEYGIYSAYPNPFNSMVQIRYNLLKAENISLKVFDLQGREIAILVQGELEAGVHSFNWNADKYASGTYLIKLDNGIDINTGKVILLK